MQNPAPAMLDDEEGIQELERRRRHRKRVEEKDHLTMVSEGRRAAAIASASTGESPPDATRSPSPVSQRPEHPTIVATATVAWSRRTGRGRFRLSTSTCGRRARTSSEVLTRLRKKTRMAARNAVIQMEHESTVVTSLDTSTAELQPRSPIESKW
jgi:hypothetical protein